MEKTVKKLYVVLFVMVLAFASGPLFSQDATVDAEVAATKEKDADAKEGKKATKAFEMGEIVVKDRAIANIEDASTTTEITDADIKARGDKTLGDSLVMVPGVQVFTQSKGNTRFNLRGYDQDKVAVFVDGIPINDVYEANFDISQIPVTNVAKIVVNRGVSSALYGTNGAIGSINVVTKQPEQPFAETNIEYGQYENYTLNMAQGAPVGDAYFWITGTLMNSGGYEISQKLDKKERRKWFDKLVRYDLYGQTFAGLSSTLESVNDYLNDTGKWNHTEYTKYQIAGKFGYNITDNIEAGVSASYYHNQQKSNTFRHNLFSSYYDDTNEWANPPGHGYVTADRFGRDAFQNRAFYWPEKYDFTVAPYIKAEFDKLSVRANAFYYKQYTNLEGYGTQDHEYSMFPPSIDDDTTLSAGNDPYQSLWTEQSYGMNIYPSYKIADWNKLNFAVMIRRDSHTEAERAISPLVSPDINAVHGMNTYETKYAAADFLTIAVEDELKPVDGVQVTVGVSYDAQNFTDNKARIDDTTYGDAYKVKDDATLWGTRDSINPVVGVVWDAMKDFLKVRAAASSKTKFPTLAAYTDVEDATYDKKMKPERSYNANAGVELTPLGRALSLRLDYFYTRFDDKLESVYSEVDTDYITTNVDGAVSKGVEALVSGTVEKVGNVVDMMLSFGYTYVDAKLLTDVTDSSINKGERFDNTPAHVFTLDMRFDFFTGTSLNIAGQHTRNQIMYTMKSAPAVGAGPYSTSYFKAERLHDPYMFNIKLSQKIMERYDVYVMCKNVLDDYNPDPFNPGPGRMFYFGGGAKL